MKNIFPLRYILLALICLGTRCGVFAQENPLQKGKYVFEPQAEFIGGIDGGTNYALCLYFSGGFNISMRLNALETDISPKRIYVEKEKLPEKLIINSSYSILHHSEIDGEMLSYGSTYEYTILEDNDIVLNGVKRGFLEDILSNYYINDRAKCISRIGEYGYLSDELVTWGPYEVKILLNLKPETINYTSRLFGERGDLIDNVYTFFPYNREVVICATPGLLEGAYNWNYNIGDGWKEMPKTVKYLQGKSLMVVKGSDIFSSEEEYNEACRSGKGISFCISTPAMDSKDSPIHLDLLKVAPKIKETTFKRLDCDGNAQIVVIFEKPVEDIDGLEFVINGEKYKERTYSWSDDNTTCTISDILGIGKYELRIDESMDYSETVEIPQMIPIDASAISTEVSCFNGKDGSITISAKGGTGVYKATLFSDEEHKQIEKEPIDFKESEKVKFENLKAGKYYMVLVDENNCSPKGQEHGHEVVSIDQPLERVKIEPFDSIMPKAYNSTDGSISVYVSGGTLISKEGKEGYTVVLKNSDGVSYSHKEPYIDNGKYMYTFENLPKGKYTMIAQDARYSPSDVNPGDEPCGCMATFSFELIAPDPIKIVVKEEQSIKCNGDNDGVLVAKVTGGISPYTYHWAKGSDEIKGDSILRNAVAGKYCLVVEDANNITSDTVYWEIKQPAPIEISFKVINPTFKKKYGSVEAIVTGGTPPYTYGWTKEGVTVNKLDSLETGEYQFYVMDSNKCGKDTTVHVSEPDEIKIDTLVFRHPSCYGTNDGEISLKISGKNSSYTAVWADNKNAGLTRKGLKPGEYTLKVSDSDGNEIELKYKMEQPEQMKLEVGSAFVLCKGQGRMITASSNVEDAEYLWKRNGREIQSAVGSELFVNQDGVYEVICKKKDSDCSVSASVNVSVSDVDLPIDITMSTDVEVDEKIHGVNISTAKMDKFEWILPDGAEKVSQSDNEIVFIMHTPGTYTVRAVGYKGGCTTEVLQTLNVKGDGEAPLPTADGDPLLKQFIVSPNPTDKEFNVHIELSEKANIKLTLKSPTGAEVETINVSDVTSYDHGYELNGDVTDCVFTLELSTGDNKQKSIQRIRKTIIKNEEK